MLRFLILVSLLLGGRGGRVAHPVALERSIDSHLTCVHLSGELNNNLKRLQELNEERRNGDSNNAGLLLVSPLLLDLSDTEKKEIKAILARNERLTKLMKGRDC